MAVTTEDAGERFAESECEACGKIIWTGDLYLPGPTPLCHGCAPKYRDLLTEPESFCDPDEMPATPEQCRAWYDAHIAAGGSPDDSMATTEAS